MSNILFVFEGLEPMEDIKASKGSRLADLAIGQSFKFGGRIYNKVNHEGWLFGFCNVKDPATGILGHIHPNRNVETV